MASTLTLVESLAGFDPLQQMTLIQQALAACKATLQEIAAHSSKLVTATKFSGPEVSTILNLALEHGVLNDRALDAANALIDRRRAGIALAETPDGATS